MHHTLNGNPEHCSSDVFVDSATHRRYDRHGNVKLVNGVTINAPSGVVELSQEQWVELVRMGMANLIAEGSTDV